MYCIVYTHLAVFVFTHIFRLTMSCWQVSYVCFKDDIVVYQEHTTEE